MQNEREHHERLPSMVIGHIHRLFMEYIGQDSGELNIPQGFRRLMFHLAHHDSVSQLELANLANLRPPTISVTLQKMEAAGLVNRVVNPADQRQIRVSLSPKGREMDERIRERFAVAERALMRGFSPEEQAELMRLLLRAEDNIKQAAEKTI